MSQLIELFDLGKSKELNIYSNSSNPSIQGISKMYEIDFSEYYHYFCRTCKTVPETKFIKKDKIIPYITDLCTLGIVPSKIFRPLKKNINVNVLKKKLNLKRFMII